jgi:transposase-like protein
MGEVHYSVSYNAGKRMFSVLKNERKTRVFPTEKAAWEYVIAKKEEANRGLGKRTGA